MVFGSSWRNRDAAHEEANQESREAGIIVEAFDSLAPAKLAPSASRLCRWRPPLHCAKRLASRRDALQFPLRTRRLQLRLIFRRDGNGFALAILL